MSENSLGLHAKLSKATTPPPITTDRRADESDRQRDPPTLCPPAPSSCDAFILLSMTTKTILQYEARVWVAWENEFNLHKLFSSRLIFSQLTDDYL